MRTMQNESTPLERAKAKCGGAAGLAAKLNELAPHNTITPQAISQWQKVPPARAADVAAVSGIPVTELRPDVFREAAA